jgi:Domain of unknown function (DUF4383)
MLARSPAQLYCLAIGLGLLLGGIAGFFYSDSFAAPGRVEDVLGILSVNGWHNLVHVLSGVVGLACAPRRGSARLFAGGFGLVYLVVCVWGFVIGSGESILGFLPVNTEDNVLHLLIALLGLLAFALSREPRSLRARFAP